MGRIKIRMPASALLKKKKCPPGPWGSRGCRLRGSKGLEGIISSSIMHWRAFFILFHHLYIEKPVYTSYFLKITASKAVLHVFVWLAHVQLKGYLNFIYYCKHVKK